MIAISPEMLSKQRPTSDGKYHFFNQNLLGTIFFGDMECTAAMEFNLFLAAFESAKVSVGFLFLFLFTN
jgi:hypothetical protein